MNSALITGAGSGIGRAIAIDLANNGWFVYVTSRKKEGAEETASLMKRNHSMVLELDITNENQVKETIQEIKNYGKGLNALINNAGTNHRFEFEDCTPDVFNEGIDINLTGHYRMCYYSLPLLKEAENSSILNISSTHAIRTQRASFPYNMAKAGVLSMTRGLAIDLAKYGVRVNSICPGFIETPINDRDLLNENSTFKKKALPYHPVGRLGKPEDIAYMASFLISDKASFVNGETIIIDGGRNAMVYTVDGL